MDPRSHPGARASRPLMEIDARDQHNGTEHLQNFASLGLAEPLVQAVTACGYTTPTPIQTQAIPPLLAGRDLLGCAQTGTGKTAAFALPVLQALAAAPMRGRRPIRALILTPTRELAAQIADSFQTYGAGLGLSHQVIFGGVGQNPQVAALRRGTDILVACPGRLLDLHGQGHVDLSHVRYFVLDEADRMLDMGFIHDVRRVLRALPRERQNLLFSATLPPAIVQLAGEFLRDPVSVSVSPEAPAVERIEQRLLYVAREHKRHLLADILRDPTIEQAIVFTRTKHGADRVVRQLDQDGIRAAAIHGNKSQSARTRALDDLRDGRLRVLIATDLASRGLDVDGVSHVINYDLPFEPESYVHRIGRTGRAGRDGMAIAFCDQDERDQLRGIERLLGRKIPVDRGHRWLEPEAMPRAPQQLLRGGRPGDARAEDSRRGGRRVA